MTYLFETVDNLALLTEFFYDFYCFFLAPIQA